MFIVGDFLLALFSAFGLLALVWLLFGRLLTPNSRFDPVTVAVICVKDDGEGLEMAIRHLRWLKKTGLAGFSIRIMDAGLSDVGLARAADLCARYPSLILCSEKDCTDYKDFTEAAHKDAT